MYIPKRRRSLLIVFAAVFLAVTVWPAWASAYVPYDTNYKDKFNQLIWTQSAYTPVEALARDIYIPDPKDPNKQIFSPLVQPKGLFIDKKDHIYIADTGNNRIVHLDEKGKLLRVIELKESPFKKPEGLFVDRNDDIYVADTGNKRVVRLDKDGKLIREFQRPDSKFLPESYKYDPIKLVVDKRGFLYIATLGGYQGLLQLDPNGKFQSFFGANKTAFSITDSLKRLLYPREMYLREISKLPGSIASVTIDKDGIIYTVTKGIEKAQVKKLNIAGKDLFANKDEFETEKKNNINFAQVRFPPKDKLTPQLNDLTVDRDGNITVVDSTLKYVNQFDGNGNLLFFWGGDTGSTTTRLGVVKTPSAIASNSKNELYILDEENNAVQKLRLSEFGALVHKANQLTQEGLYEESEEPWQEVLRLNAYYTPAVLGLAKAAYRKGDYVKAQKLFEEAGVADGYSDSFWQTRLVWFQKHFGTLMNSVLLLGALLIIFKKLSKKSRWGKRWHERQRTTIPMLVQLRHAFYILKHPLDGFSAIRYEGKGSFLSSTIMLLLALVSYCTMKAGTSFTFNPTKILQVNLGIVTIQFLVVWLGWVISNYLISTIYRGEGRFRDVVYGSSYALFPFVVVGLPLTLISNAMTLNEKPIYSFLETGLIIWIALMIFWKVQALQNYSVGETAINIFLSLVTMTILGVLIFITFALSKELTDFIYSVYQEVTIR